MNDNHCFSLPLNEKEAARYLGVSASFLQKAREHGQLSDGQPGPTYLRLGKRKVAYLKEHLDAFLQACLTS